MNAWSSTTYKGFAFAKCAYGPFKPWELLKKCTRLLSCVVIFPSPEWTRVTLLGTAASPDRSPSDWSGSQATKKDHLPGDTEWSSAQGRPEWGSSLRVNPSLVDFREISGARRTLGTESLKKKNQVLRMNPTGKAEDVQKKRNWKLLVGSLIALLCFDEHCHLTTWVTRRFYLAAINA